MLLPACVFVYNVNKYSSKFHPTLLCLRPLEPASKTFCTSQGTYGMPFPGNTFSYEIPRDWMFMMEEGESVGCLLPWKLDVAGRHLFLLMSSKFSLFLPGVNLCLSSNISPAHLLSIFLTFVVILCVYECIVYICEQCHHVAPVEVRGQVCAVSSLLSESKLWGSNSGQVAWQVPLPAKSSHWFPISFYI